MDFDTDDFLFEPSSQSYRLIDYDNTSTCTLCGISDICDNSDWKKHEDQWIHRKRHAEITRLMEIEKDFSFRRREVISLLKPRVSNLGLQAWRDRVNVLLLDYMTDDSCSDVDVSELLEKYELMEQVSLLELTIWKTSCQMSEPSGRSGDSFDWHCWLSSDWQQKKGEMRHSNAIAIVITHVLPFLLGDCSNKKARRS